MHAYNSSLLSLAQMHGVVGEDGRKMLGWIGSKLAKKWQKDRSIVMSYIRARLSVAVARAISACIRGDGRPKNI